MNKKIILTLGLLMASWSAWAAPFQAISAYSPDGIHVGVCFNQAVDTGNDLFNYSDGNAGGGVVETHVRTNTAAFPNKNKTVILTLNHAVGGPFTVTFSSVANAAQTETFSGSLPVDVGSFTSADIGCNALGESFSCSGGAFEIEAGGQDVWDDTQAKFLYEARSGDFDVIVQVTADQAGANRAGLMVRQDTTVRPLEVSEVTHSSGLEGSFKRVVVGGGMAWLSPSANWTGVTFPKTWARIQRLGNSIAAFQSTDGVFWKFDGRVTLAMTDPVLVGLVHNNGDCNNHTLTMATFSHYAGICNPNHHLVINSQPASITVEESRKATFSVSATAFDGTTVLDPGEISYQWQKKCPGDPDFADIPGAVSSSYTTPTLSHAADDQCQYRAKLAFSVCATATSDPATLKVTKDTTPPSIVSVSAVASGASDSLTIAICFNELMDPSPTGASDPFNYNITGVGGNPQIAKSELLSDGTTVVLHIVGLPENSFTLHVDGAPDLAGNAIAATDVPVTVNRSFTITDIGAAATPGDAYGCAANKLVLTSTGGGVRNNGGDQLNFAYQTVTGDFDKKVQIASITRTDSSDPWARGGLMARESLDPKSASMKLIVGAPAPGADVVRSWGRATNGMNYTDWGRGYGGVHNAMPNQWIRLRRIGNDFTFFVGTNGTQWSMVAEKWVDLVPTLLLGLYAGASSGTDTAIVQFCNYMDSGCTDASQFSLVSAGTIDHKKIGVKFSKQVNAATAEDTGNYSIAGTVVTKATVGIGGNTVYLDVSPDLASDAFTVSVQKVKDSCGNTIATSSVSGKRSPWNSTDIGLIQAYPTRGTVGDDPGRVGQAVAVSSDGDPEIEIIGGGSNAWNPGDYIHYLWNDTKLVGDFDVYASVDRNDVPANTAGWGNSGLMLRNALYRAGLEGANEGTKAAMVANTTYFENGQNRSAIPLWRGVDGAGYDNGDPQGAYGTIINGIKGYYSGLNVINSSGVTDPQSSPTSKRFLRIKRHGADFTFYNSFDGLVWNAYNVRTIPSLTGDLLFGFSTMGDVGANAPPHNAYGGNATIDQNLYNHSTQRVKIGLIRKVSITYNGTSGQVSWQGAGKLQSAPSITGPWSDLPDQTNPQPVNPSNIQFYRLKN